MTTSNNDAGGNNDLDIPRDMFIDDSDEMVGNIHISNSASIDLCMYIPS